MQFHLTKIRIRLADGSHEHRWYARAVVTGYSTQEMLSSAISDKTTVTPTDVKAVIDALHREIKGRLREGQIVQLGELGHFQLSIKNNGGSLTKDSWTRDLIKGARVLYRVTKSMSEIANDVSMTRWVNLEAGAIMDAAIDAHARVKKTEKELNNVCKDLLQLQAQATKRPNDATLTYKVLEKQATMKRLQHELKDHRAAAQAAQEEADQLQAQLDGHSFNSLEDALEAIENFDPEMLDQLDEGAITSEAAEQLKGSEADNVKNDRGSDSKVSTDNDASANASK